MTNSVNNKTWHILDGVLSFEKNREIVIPTADEIYSAVFENIFTKDISNEDIDELRGNIEFSKYPVDLQIVLQSTKDFVIELNVNAYTFNKDYTRIAWGNNADHIVINNKWHPFTNGSIDYVLEILRHSDIEAPGKINLRQYLSLIKSSQNEIRNEIDSEQLKVPASTDERPFGVNAQLYPYQQKGWQWLRFMAREKIGGILADEMGLGKTLQIISLISSELQYNSSPSLIVAPATLLENWRREIEKFASHITTNIHHGSSRTGFPDELRKYKVTITSYETIIRDSSLFCQIDWNILVCDEAQAIKNPSTKRAISIKRVPRQVAFAVTGTPIENRLLDLWSLMDFVIPGFLGEKSDFENLFQNSPDGPTQLEAIISPLILRRQVAEVAKDLPAKIVIPQVMELGHEEITQYEQIRIDTLSEFASNASLVVLVRLRLFCAHPFLTSGQLDEDPAMHSNKYRRLVEIMEEIVVNGAKAIVFTSFNKMNDLIVSDIGKRFNIPASSIDGRTATPERQKIVDKFSAIKGAAILVLNPIAAGTGLNITAANHVIHYNLEWNPAKEDQASARAYRRGQDRPVTIHRLFYANTIEEAINERLDRKRSLAGTAIVGVQGDIEDYNDIVNALRRTPDKNHDPNS